VYIGADGQAGGFNTSDQFLGGGARVSRAFEADRLPCTQMWQDRFDRAHNIGEVGLKVLIQRRGNTQDDRVDFTDLAEVCCGGEIAGLDRRGDGVRRDVFDIAGASVDCRRLLVIDVESYCFEPAASIGECEGKTDIAESNNTHRGATILNP